MSRQQHRGDPIKERSGGKGGKSPVKSFVELVLTIAVAVGLALLIQAFLVKPYRIPSPSMVPTLDVGQRVLTNRLDTHPSVGDIVVFHPPHGADNVYSPSCGNPTQGTNHRQACDQPSASASTQTFIKRAVAGPGDSIRILKGHVYRNGKREADSYINQCGSSDSCTFPQAITIPPGHYFMMGDNRGLSDDSRFWGPVPQQWIIGVAFFTYWPPSRIGTL
jgi:signal peptidase I